MPFVSLFVWLLVNGFPVANAANLTPIRVQLKWQHQFQFAGYYAAVEKGFYQQAGLDVTLLPAASGKIDPVNVVLSGAAEYGVGTSDLLLKRAQGKPVVVLAAFFQHSPLAIIALKKAGIQSLHDLVGKQVMVEQGADELLAYFRREGIDQSELSLLPHTFSVTDLLNGKVAAMSVYITDEPYELVRMKQQFMIYSPRTGGIDFYGDNLFTSEEELKRHPERVKAFREATVKGWKYAMTHIDEMADIIHQKYSSKHSVEHLRYEANSMIPLLQTPIVEPGHMYLGRWQHIADVYAELGMIKKDFDLTGFVSLNNNEEELQQLRSWIITLSLVVAVLVASFMLVSKKNQQIRYSEKRYKDLLETMPVVFAMIDLSKNIVLWNTEATKIFGWPLADAVGQNINDLIVPQSGQAHVNQILDATLSDGIETHSRNENITQDGVTVTCEWRNTPFMNTHGEVAGVICLGVDVTQQALAHYKLEEAKALAEKLLEEQKQFLQMVSHEMRSPLAVVDTAAQLIEVHTRDDDRAQMLIQRVRRGVSRLTRFIQQCISDDKIQQLSANGLVCVLQNVNMKALLAAVTEQIEMMGITGNTDTTTDTTQRIEVDASDQAFSGDPALLKMLLLNLIGNAVKYSPETSVVKIKGAVASDGMVTLQVSDQGVGVPMNDLPNITKCYVRGQNTAQISGLGLGLYIVETIAALHYGTLTIESEPGKGTTVTVVFPGNRVNDRG